MFESSYADERRRMVDKQLVARGISDARVIQAMLEIPREEFVPGGLRDQAYLDAALPIDYGQTISQPYTVAYMCEALQLTGGETVLEVGTGSGYGAAVLSRLAGQVYTVERIVELAATAKARLERLGYANVDVRIADGTLGLPEVAPFDAIIATAAAEELPSPYQQQLVEGGRIVMPLGSAHSQCMYRFTLRSGMLHRENLGGFAFVPLIGRYGLAD
jgi:protein-L-isoaspartate(D-aspartate) O-methyltransferase